MAQSSFYRQVSLNLLSFLSLFSFVFALPPHPVIFVPGLGGSVLEAKLDGFHGSSKYCPEKTEKYGDLWLHLPDLVFASKCFFDELELSYNSFTNTYSFPPGVHIRPKDWGGLKGVDAISHVLGRPFPHTQMFDPVITALKAQGYKEGVSLRGAPYDFRMPPDRIDLEHDWRRFVTLIEDTFALNGNRTVHIVTHSMGSMKMAYVFSRMPQAWKDTYIAGFISLSGPWLGATKGLRTVISGDNMGIAVGSFEIMPHRQVRDKLKKSGAVWMVPDARYFGDETFVITDSRNYSANQFGELFGSLDKDMAVVYKHTQESSIFDLGPPGVPVHCFYGTGFATESQLIYKGSLPDTEPARTYEDGDGTVSHRSLDYCSQWAGAQKAPVSVRAFRTDHCGLLSNKESVAAIVRVITA